jgi:peptidoglycan/xylan/chitin deacetylase (PgdA/CDA1 family)
MITHWSARLQQTTRRLRRRWGRRSIILLYHRIADLSADPWSLAVTPSHFAEHLEVLNRKYHTVALQQIVSMQRSDRSPHRSVSVTFDDGYADLLHNARPLLDRYGIPATVFVPAGMIGSKQEFWWDELERLLLQPGVLPGELRLNIQEQAYVWSLDESALYSQDSAEQYRYWKAWQPAPTARHALYYSLWKQLQRLPSDQRQTVLNELRVWSGAGAVGRPTHRTLSYEELRALSAGGLVDIGAHTVTHPVLAALSMADQRTEIQQSKVQLEEIVGQPVTTFAYPYGKLHDYTKETVSLLRQAGFTCACLNVDGVVRRAADPYALPRIFVPDCDGETFARLLSEWS